MKEAKHHLFYGRPRNLSPFQLKSMIIYFLLVPESPYSLDILVTNPEVTLTWKPPLKTNGIMVGYQVTVRKLPVGQINIIDVGNQRLEQEFEALDLEAKYQFALLARNRVGFGPPLVVNIDLKKGRLLL